MGLSFSTWPHGAIERCVVLAVSLSGDSGVLGDTEVGHLTRLARHELPNRDESEVVAFLTEVLAAPELHAVRRTVVGTVSITPATPRADPQQAASPPTRWRNAQRAPVSASAPVGSLTPHVKIGTIGHVGHGKTTLTAAMTKVLHDKHSDLNRFTPFDVIDKAPAVDLGRGTMINIAHVEYQTDKRHYAHVDAPSHADIMNMIAGSAQLDCAILVVSALDGPMAQTCEQVLLARQMGVCSLLVALNKADMVDEEILKRVGAEVREFLSSQGFDGDNCPVIHVSALRALEGEPTGTAQIEALLDAVDQYSPTPSRDITSPFFMPIDEVLSISGRGTVVTGRVERGQLTVNAKVEVVGTNRPIKATVASIETSRKLVDSAAAGENASLALRGVKREEVSRGQIVCAPGGFSRAWSFDAVAHFFQVESGSNIPIRRGSYFFCLWDAEHSGRLSLVGCTETFPGAKTRIRVELKRQWIPLKVGLGFAIRAGGTTIGFGRITNVW